MEFFSQWMNRIGRFSESFQIYLLEDQKIQSLTPQLREEIRWRQISYFSYLVFAFAIGVPIWLSTTGPKRASLPPHIEYPPFSNCPNNECSPINENQPSFLEGENKLNAEENQQQRERDWSTAARISADRSPMELSPAYHIRLLFVHHSSPTPAADASSSSITDGRVSTGRAEAGTSFLLRSADFSRQILKKIRQFSRLHFDPYLALEFGADHIFDFPPFDSFLLPPATSTVSPHNNYPRSNNHFHWNLVDTERLIAQIERFIPASPAPPYPTSSAPSATKIGPESPEIFDDSSQQKSGSVGPSSSPRHPHIPSDVVHLFHPIIKIAILFPQTDATTIRREDSRSSFSPISELPPSDADASDNIDFDGSDADSILVDNWGGLVIHYQHQQQKQQFNPGNKNDYTSGGIRQNKTSGLRINTPITNEFDNKKGKGSSSTAAKVLPKNNIGKDTIRRTLDAILAVLRSHFGLINDIIGADEEQLSSNSSRGQQYKLFEAELAGHKMCLARENIKQVVHLLNSLHELSETQEDLVISEEVAMLAHKSYNELLRAISFCGCSSAVSIPTRNGSNHNNSPTWDADNSSSSSSSMASTISLQQQLLVSSSRARMLAELATHHSSQLELLNFPSDQKHGVYTPLLLPVLIPIFLPIFQLIKYILFTFVFIPLKKRWTKIKNPQ